MLGKLSVALLRRELRLDDYNTIILLIQSSSIAGLRALPYFLSLNSFSCHKSSVGGIPEEGILFSLGVAMRHGNMFRIDKMG